MRFQTLPWSLNQLALTALLTLPVLALPPQQAGIDLNQLFGRAACASTQQACGFYTQLCCPMGGCYTDANNQAQCSTPAATAAGTAGYWTQITTTVTTTGALTLTSVYSTYIGATPTATAVSPAATGCNYALNESPCGSICCASNQYCYQPGSCAAAANGGSTGYLSSFYSTMYATTNSAGVPLRPTSSTLIVITANPSTTASSTVTPGTTEPFQTPVATGANVTITSASSNNSSGLSGGAIAGIVIGVLAAIFILACICFYCCLRGLVDGCLAFFGLGGRRRREKEVDIYERRTHHSSGGGGGRTWYGARRPARSDRPTKRRSEVWNVIGIGACLAGLWAILGLKNRRNNAARRREEEKSEYSYYDSEYYTSASELTLTRIDNQDANDFSGSASSDRRTRDDRYSRR